MSLVHDLRDRFVEYGDTRGVVFLAGPADPAPARLTYAELDRQARAAAVWLAANGQVDRPVLLAYPPGLGFLGGLLGCLYARAVAVPVAPPTGRHDTARLRTLVRETGTTMILTDPELREPLAAAGFAVAVPDADADADAWASPSITDDTLAYLQYTSGSTLAPRGVRIPHRAVRHNLACIQSLGDEPHRTLAGWLPHYHDFGLVGLDLNALTTGADLILTSPATFISHPVTWFHMITRYRATCVAAPDFGYMWCTRRITDEQLDGVDLSSVTMAFTGSERINPSTLDGFERRFGPYGFRPSAWAPGYGMAEATLLITGTRQGRGATVERFDTAALEQHRAEPDAAGTPLVASGRPVDLRLRIVDPHTHEPLPDRHIGEIWISGTSVGDGYEHQPDATAATFHRAADGTWLGTGDLGFTDDGELYVTGRLKETIIINGRNLYAHDLEDAAHRAHPATGLVAAVAAVAVTTPDGEHAVLIQELRSGHPPAEAVADAIATAIGQQFQIPIGIVLVPAGTIRRTTSGKVRRHEMRELLRAGEIDAVYQELSPEIRATIGVPA